MEDATAKAVETPAAPDPELVKKALGEYESQTDRVAVILKYPFLRAILNAPKPK